MIILYNILLCNIYNITMFLGPEHVIWFHFDTYDDLCEDNASYDEHGAFLNNIIYCQEF